MVYDHLVTWLIHLFIQGYIKVGTARGLMLYLTGTGQCQLSWDKNKEIREAWASKAKNWKQIWLSKVPVWRTYYSGGFEEKETVKCNQTELEISNLRACHEQADTRIILHASHCVNKSGFINILESARDTDMLALLLAHFHEINVETARCQLTARHVKCIPVHEVYKCLTEGSTRAILLFYAMTRCDATSFFFGQSKQTTYKLFRE